MAYINYTDFISDHACGYEWAVSRAINNYIFNTSATKIDVNSSLQNYYSNLESIIGDYQQNLINNPTYTRSEKVFPIIFHLIYDDISVIKPGNSQNIDFNPTYIIQWINHWFAGTGISFKAVALDPSGELLNIPGLNLYNGNTINQVRTIFNNNISTETNVNYVADGVALDEFVSKNNKDSIPGVTLNYIQSNYGWDHTRYINIFLVNRTNSGLGKVCMTAQHPFIPEITQDYSSLAIAIDLWAIGNSYDANIPLDAPVSNNTEFTNFGYSYDNTESANAIDYNIGFRSRAKTIVHSLGHFLGLTHVVNNFMSPISDLCHIDDTMNLFSGLGKAHEDSDPDTQHYFNMHSMLEYSNALDINSCSDNTILSDSNTHMHINQFTGAIAEENTLTPIFTEMQINIMHATCEVLLSEYSDEAEQMEYRFSIPGQILANSINLETSPFIEDRSLSDPCVNNPASTTRNNNFNIPSSGTLESEEIVSFNDSKKVITNILNSFK